jgi:hypothetical protein
MGLTLNEMYLKERTNLTDGKIFLMTNKEKVAFKANWVEDIRNTLQKYHFPEVWNGYPPAPTHKIVLKTK